MRAWGGGRIISLVYGLDTFLEMPQPLLLFYCSRGDLLVGYGEAGMWWTMGGRGVVVSYENAMPWTLPFPSEVEKWPQGGG